MTQQEQARLQVLNNLLAGYRTTEQAATLMGVSFGVLLGAKIAFSHRIEEAQPPVLPAHRCIHEAGPSRNVSIAIGSYTP